LTADLGTWRNDGYVAMDRPQSAREVNETDNTE
jgi:hypothetical protein